MTHCIHCFMRKGVKLNCQIQLCGRNVSIFILLIDKVQVERHFRWEIKTVAVAYLTIVSYQAVFSVVTQCSSLHGGELRDDQRKAATEANVTHQSYPTRYCQTSDATRKKLLAMMYLSKNEIALVLKTLPHDSYVTLQENFKFSAHQSKLGASRDE